MSNLQRHNFTLLDLTAVIAILLLLTAVSGVYIGRERKMSAFEQALREVRVLCARARAETMRDGVVRKVVFYPGENLFRIEAVPAEGESEAVVTVEAIEDGDLPYVVLDAIDLEWEREQAAAAEDAPENRSGEENPAVLQWQFPAALGVKIELPDLQDVAFTEDSLEMWRYTPGGSARLSHALSVQVNGDVRLLTVSDFTGLLTVTGELADQGKVVW